MACRPCKDGDLPLATVLADIEAAAANAVGPVGQRAVAAYQHLRACQSLDVIGVWHFDQHTLAAHQSLSMKGEPGKLLGCMPVFVPRLWLHIPTGFTGHFPGGFNRVHAPDERHRLPARQPQSAKHVPYVARAPLRHRQPAVRRAARAAWSVPPPRAPQDAWPCGGGAWRHDPLRLAFALRPGIHRTSFHRYCPNSFLVGSKQVVVPQPTECFGPSWALNCTSDV
jgi:hypothetical protein